MTCSFRLHAAAVDEIRGAIASARAPYVAVSGGKDSMLMASLVIEVDPDVPMVHSTHGAQWFPSHWPGLLLRTLRQMGAQQAYSTPQNLIYERNLGFDLAFVGLRRAESQRRRARMDARMRPLNPEVTECWPLADWPTSAVWECTRAHGIPYANLYEGKPEGWRMHWPRDYLDRGDWQRLHYMGGTVAADPPPDDRAPVKPAPPTVTNPYGPATAEQLAMLLDVYNESHGTRHAYASQVLMAAWGRNPIGGARQRDVDALLHRLLGEGSHA